MSSSTLGIGFIGSGFNTRFHIRSWVGVRDADVRGVWSPNTSTPKKRRLSRDHYVSAMRKRSIRSKKWSPTQVSIASGCADQITCESRTWKRSSMRSLQAKEAHRDRLREAARAQRRRSETHGRACREERTVARLSREPIVYAGDSTGRALIWARGAALTGRPYLARAAEEHSGPHMPWFWQGELQGGGVLNDMMCHSVEVARYMLTEPGKPRASIRPTAVSAQIASLKWSRPEYVERLKTDDGQRRRLSR